MAKVGYVLTHDQYTNLDSDRKWMEDYGCDPIIEEHQSDSHIQFNRGHSPEQLADKQSKPE